MVIVPHSILVEGRRPGGLNAPEEPFVHHHSQGVVNGLARNGTDVCSNDFGDGVRRAMGSSGNRPKHRQALGSDGNVMFAKQSGRIVHISRLNRFLDNVQKKTLSDNSNKGKAENIRAETPLKAAMVATVSTRWRSVPD